MISLVKLKYYYITFLFISLIFLICGSTYLRPAADDYCHGQYASFGLIGGVHQWWKTWSGFLLSNFFGNLTIGLPLLHFEWNFASSFTFLITSFSISASLLFLIFKYFSDYKDRFVIFLFFNFAWITFLLSPKHFELFNHESQDLASGLLHWQTLNGTYVLQFIFIIVCFNFIKSINFIVLKNSLAFLLFILSGTAGSSISLSIFILIFLYFILIKFSFNFLNSISTNFLICAFLGCLLGVIISHLSPGNIIRAEALKPNLNIGIFNYFIIFLKSTFWTSKYIIFNFLNYSTILTIALLTLSFNILIPNTNEKDKIFILNSAIFFITISIITSFTSFLAGYFTYNAYWHRTTSHVSFFYFLVFASIGLSNSIYFTFLNRNKLYLSHLLYISILSISLLTQYFSFLSVKERSKKWDLGPAPVLSVTDIEVDWVRICWDNLNNSRVSKIIR